MLSAEETEKLRQQLEKSLKVKIRPKWIKAIRVNATAQWQPPLHVEVGSYCANLEKDSPTEQIVAIFESTTFLVCTPDRGVAGGMPYFFSREDVRQVFEME